MYKLLLVYCDKLLFEQVTTAGESFQEFNLSHDNLIELMFMIVL